jgi:tRNA (Thr-GGU) A37 N-methylase
VTTVEVLGRKGNKLKVKGLDIIDGTPIIDIKPYWPVYDEVKGAKVPEWVGKLDV